MRLGDDRQAAIGDLVDEALRGVRVGETFRRQGANQRLHEGADHAGGSNARIAIPERTLLLAHG